MNLYSIDIPIVATAYIKAESPEEALAIVNRDLTDTGLEFIDRYQGCGDNVCMDGRSYECLVDNDEEIALSPAMSLNEKSYTADDIDFVDVIGEDEDA